MLKFTMPHRRGLRLCGIVTAAVSALL